jgi:hypothetical protein
MRLLGSARVKLSTDAAGAVDPIALSPTPDLQQPQSPQSPQSPQPQPQQQEEEEEEDAAGAGGGGGGGGGGGETLLPAGQSGGGLLGPADICKVLRGWGAKNASLSFAMPLYTETNHVTKTGSGQT